MPQEGAAAAAPAALALSATADIVTTVSMASLACVQAGPLQGALLLRTADPPLNAAGSLLDILLASVLRALLTFCQVSSGARCAGAGGPAAPAAAATVLHVLAAAWLVAKGALTLRLTGGRVAGEQLVAGDVTLSGASLLGAEALGVLFSG